MPKYLLLVICLVLGCGRQSAATLGAGLIPHDAATSPRSTPVTPAAAETSKGGPTPYPKDDSNWPGVGVIRVFEFMIPRRQDIWSQRLVNQGAVVFVGDSNVEAWTSLKGDFAPMHVANVGIGGDVSRGVLFRLKEDVIDLNPRAVVILIGSNDVAAKEDPDLYIANLTSILRALRDYNRLLPIVLCKLPPRGQDLSPLYNKDVLNVNYSLDSLVKSDPKLSLLDLYQLLSLPDGSFDPDNFQGDKVHMSHTGYKKFHDALIPIFHRLQVE